MFTKVYNEKVPIWLRNRPCPFVDHCLKRLGAREQRKYMAKSDLEEFDVDLDVSSCSCPDFHTNRWPCKHILAIFRKFPESGWDTFPEPYKNCPIFNLDNKPIISQPQPEIHLSFHRMSKLCMMKVKTSIKIAVVLLIRIYFMNTFCSC